MVDVTAIAGNALNIGIIIGAFIFAAIVIIGIVIGVLQWKKFADYTCIIFEKDGFGQLRRKIDNAGIFVDSKTKNKRFFMRKSKVGLDPDTVPYVCGPGNRKTVYLYQTGLKNFHFIRIKVDRQFNLSVGEEDVNWAINAYDRQKKLFGQSLIMQMMPFLALAFVSIIILVIFIYFFKNFDTLADVAVALKEAAQAMAQAKSGTTVIG